MRTTTMLLISVAFIGTIAWFQLDLLAKDRQLFNWKSWKYGLKTLFGLRNSYLTGLIRPYFEFYKPGFHPSQQDTQALEQRWRMRLGFAG